MKARQSFIIIKYNGKDITEKITDYIEGFQYTDNASGKADTVTLKLNNRSGRWLRGWIPRRGDYVEAKIRLTNWRSEGDNRKLNCGFFLIDDLSFSGPPDVASIGGISTPISTDFNVTEKSRTWKKTTVKGILEKIARDAGVGLYFSGADYLIDETEQSKETNQAFAFKLCSSYNLAMKLYNKKIVVFDQTEYERKKAGITIERDQCQSYTIKKKMTKAYDGVSISYTDPKTDKTLKYEFMIGKGNRMLKMNESAESLQDAEIKAKAKLLGHNRSCQAVTLKVKGDVKYISSKCCELSGFGKLDGKYYIDTVRHEKDPGGGYICTLDLHLCIAVDGVKPAKISGNKPKEKNVHGFAGSHAVENQRKSSGFWLKVYDDI
ncbi:MAG: hypothetical protein HFH36_12460 [Lachnospiraceae bacterium]|nr:hypothetical protein [Lachnospiraceae bacterium]